ncbi:MAG: thioredoxin domain-containing protein [Bacteroidota bacterium]
MNQRRYNEIKIFAVIGALCTIAAAVMEYVPSSATVQWQPYATAFQTAARENKKVYVDVYAEWCGPCKLMDRTTFANDTVMAMLQNDVIAVRVNIDDEKIGAEVKKKFNIQAMPTSLLLMPDQMEIKRNVGYMDGTQFIDWIADTAVSEFSRWDDFPGAATRAAAEHKKIFIVALQDSLKVYELDRAFRKPAVKRLIRDKCIPTLLLNNNTGHQKFIRQYVLLPSIDFIGYLYVFSPAMELLQAVPLRNYDGLRLQEMVQQIIADAEKPA